MRSRTIVGMVVVISLVGVGVLASRAGEVTSKRQWTLVNFVEPVRVQNQLVMGPVMILHDSEKMSRGEACTTFYRFDRVKGPQEALLSFHCQPMLHNGVRETTFTYADDGQNGCKRLIKYQIAGDEEAHGVPLK